MKAIILFFFFSMLIICSCSRHNYICNIESNIVLNHLYIKNDDLNKLVDFKANDSIKNLEAAIQIIDSFDIYFKSIMNHYDKGCMDESLTFAYLYTLEDYGPELIRIKNEYIVSHPSGSMDLFIKSYRFYNSDWLITVANELPINALIELQILKMNLLQYAFYIQSD